ncbi:MAG TPA: DNA adenine methylase, partial [Tepidiformaceae bacterium]|nr:DNA adenine methylase [Tepidiformaceae bacterium]
MATPFLKWAGGKARLVPQILAAAPAEIATYHEPFVGAGAVYFGFEAAGLLRRAALSDSNRELM